MTEDIISRIDQAVGCQQCPKALKPNGPSPDFCSEECQQMWHADRAAKQWPASDDFARSGGFAWGGQVHPPGWTVAASARYWSGRMENASARFTPAKPLRPSVPVSERVAAVERLASHAGITLAAWQPQAIETMYAGGTVIRGRRNGWSTIARLMQVETDQRRIHGVRADQVILDGPAAHDHEDCRCELLDVIATNPAEVALRSINDVIARMHQVPLATVRTEPIKLTHEQWDQVLRSSPEPGPSYLANGALGDFWGVPVELVDTLEESTPYREGWIRPPESATADPQRGWLAKWFRRHR